MPYLVKSKGRMHRVRDGYGPEAPMYEVPAEKQVLFDNLPYGCSDVGDSDLLIEKVKSPDGHERGKLVVREKPVTSRAHEFEKVDKSAEPKEPKRRPRLR